MHWKFGRCAKVLQLLLPHLFFSTGAGESAGDFIWTNGRWGKGSHSSSWECSFPRMLFVQPHTSWGSETWNSMSSLVWPRVQITPEDYSMNFIIFVLNYHHYFQPHTKSELTSNLTELTSNSNSVNAHLGHQKKCCRMLRTTSGKDLKTIPWETDISVAEQLSCKVQPKKENISKVRRWQCFTWKQNSFSHQHLIGKKWRRTLFWNGIAQPISNLKS